MGFFSSGFENEFETAMKNEPSVFEPLKVNFIIKGNATRLLNRANLVYIFLLFAETYFGFYFYMYIEPTK